MKQELTLRDLQHFEELLWESHDRLSEDLARLEGDLGADSERPEAPERAKVVEDRARSQQLRERQDRVRAEVRSAIEKIPEGTYGLCEECGSWIDVERLEELPYARTCAQCASRSAAGEPGRE